MRNILNYLTYVPKQVVAVAAIFVLSLSAMAAPIVSDGGVMAQDNEVRLEADVKVMNLNTSSGYQDNVSAMVDDVVQIQVWYHNMEEFDSGKDAENLKVAIDVPSTRGKNQTITATVGADNADTVTTTAGVNLSLDNAYLEYIAYGEGSSSTDGGVQWRHNKGAADGNTSCQTEDEEAPNSCYVSENLGAAGDAIVNGGIVIEDEYRPCFAYQSTVTILARVKAEAIKVNKYVRNVTRGETSWKLKNQARPEDILEYRIRFENKGNVTLEDVTVGDNLPDYLSYIPGSTTIMNGNYPDGVAAGSNNVWQGGIMVGDYAPGAAGYVTFRVKVDPVNVFEKCGTYTLKNVGVVRPEGMNEFYNTAHTDVKIDCEKGDEELPAQLPQTGIGGLLGGIFGSGALGVGIRNWFGSRRKLLASLLEN
ncbi:MAG: DUF11 domain-containing protein [Candidatus Saccharimonadales bacterium]